MKGKIFSQDYQAGCKRGFTLVEILVVVIIIGMLLAVALPQYQVTVDKAHFMQLVSDVEAVKKAEEDYFLAHRDYTMDLEELDVTLGEHVRDQSGVPGTEHLYWFPNKETKGNRYIGLKNAIYRSEENSECSGGNALGCTAGNIVGNDGRTGAQYMIYLDQAWTGDEDDPTRPDIKIKRRCVARPPSDGSHKRSVRLCKALGGVQCDAAPFHTYVDDGFNRSFCLQW